MSKFELKLPQMGESVAEATLTSWLKDVGDVIEVDEAVFEIATDKVDSDVPSEVEGVLLEKLFNEDDVIKVGQTVAIIEISVGGKVSEKATTVEKVVEDVLEETVVALETTVTEAKDTVVSTVQNNNGTERFYSPLVKNIAKQEGITIEELDSISGTGKEDRVTKNDILGYLENRSAKKVLPKVTRELPETPAPIVETAAKTAFVPPVYASKNDEVIPMTRMGKLIAQHMTNSISTSAHVQSFIEVDVTKIVNWRNKTKGSFETREGEKLTFTPIFMEAIAKALKTFPMLNVSVDGTTVIKKKNINIGMAAALPDGNLIVPVIKNADQLNLVGMAKAVNDLAYRAKNNELKPDEVKDGTYTVTNVGSFGSVFGTPIINQPQVGILALGAIRKTPSVIETNEGDFIGIRSKMFLSHSYDHRVVNGAMGGMFIKAIKDYLEAWDENREI
ncbi:MAG: diapophytoene dehydrogenase [Flavobacteriaceae bacterium]|nr:MAG: diapophytoene dehydrogenase [Flavobacteriaceae bacterium]